ncbi:MAG: hypothetical protein Q4A42_05350 [Tissierellia bacterium]|nr:hypothetical protein [Tissierellia bacterium]
MEKNKKVLLTSMILAILPLLTLFLTWAGPSGVKTYTGEYFVTVNRFSSVLGYMLVLVAIFIEMRKINKLLMVAIGNIIFWLPLIIKVFKEFSLVHISKGFYFSMVIVIFLFLIQVFYIHKNKE